MNSHLTEIRKALSYRDVKIMRQILITCLNFTCQNLYKCEMNFRAWISKGVKLWTSCGLRFWTSRSVSWRPCTWPKLYLSVFAMKNSASTFVHILIVGDLHEDLVNIHNCNFMEAANLGKANCREFRLAPTTGTAKESITQFLWMKEKRRCQIESRARGKV